MFELKGLFGVIILVLDIWAIVRIIESPKPTSDKVLWIAIIVLLPLLGFLLWYFIAKK